MNDKKNQGKKPAKKALKIMSILVKVALVIAGVLLLSFFCSLARYIINLFG